MTLDLLSRKEAIAMHGVDVRLRHRQRVNAIAEEASQHRQKRQRSLHDYARGEHRRLVAIEEAEVNLRLVEQRGLCEGLVITVVQVDLDVTRRELQCQATTL